MTEPRQITDAAGIKRFALAGNATFTLRSERTGARFTFRVRASEDRKVHFVSVLDGSSNETDFAYLGVVRGGRYSRTAKSRVSEDAASARAFEWFWALVANGRSSDAATFWHEGRCGRCGRKLTVPESIETGLGPECAGKTDFACEAA